MPHEVPLTTSSCSGRIWPISAHPSHGSCPFVKPTHDHSGWVCLRASPHGGTLLTLILPHTEPHLRPQWASSHAGRPPYRHTHHTDRAPQDIPPTAPVGKFACGPMPTLLTWRSTSRSKNVYLDHSGMIGHRSGIARLRKPTPNNLLKTGIPEHIANPSKEKLSALQHL